MAEWKLFDAEPPEFTRLEHLRDQGWMNLEAQPGWQQRSILVARHARWLADGALLAAGGRVAGVPPVRSVTDLGCGDGSMLALLATVMQDGLPMWGYEINAGDVAYARGRGLDVRQASILDPGLEYGDLLIATEVLEHLAGPEAFLRGLPGQLLIVSSPSAETGDWHNPIHAWAWDMAGYSALIQRSGWTVLAHNECDGGPNTFAGVTGQQRFQAIMATRDLLKVAA